FLSLSRFRPFDKAVLIRDRSSTGGRGIPTPFQSFFSVYEWRRNAKALGDPMSAMHLWHRQPTQPGHPSASPWKWRGRGTLCLLSTICVKKNGRQAEN